MESWSFLHSPHSDSPCPQGAHGGQEPQPSWQWASWVEYFLPPILQAAWDVAFKQVFTCIHLSNCQINCHQLSNQSLNSHSEILWSWGCKITPWAMRTCACATCCHEWNAAMASWLRTAGSCGRWALTLLPARSSGTKSLALYGTLEGSNLFWIRQGSLPFALWSYGNLDQQW